MHKAEYALMVKPLKNSHECGDTGIIKEFDDKVFLGLIDAAGHSKNSYKIAVSSREFLLNNYRKDLIEIVQGLHKHLRGSNGAVAGLCLLDLETGHVKYVGIGDVTARKFGSKSVRIMSKPGIIGYTMPTPKENNLYLTKGDVLIMYTDGVKDHFELDNYPEILKKDLETVADHIIFQYGRTTDDAACIVLKYK